MNRRWNFQSGGAVAVAKSAALGCALLFSGSWLLGAAPAPASVTLEGFVAGVGTAEDVVVDGVSGLAYVACDEFGLAVVDVSNPSQPVALGGANPPFWGTHVALSGSLAVISSGSLGMSIVDVSVATAPATVGHMSGTINGVARAGQYAYILISVPGNPPHTDLAVVDLTIPATPSIVGRVTLAGGTGIKVVAGLAYVSTGSSGLQIVDVSIPTVPTIVTTVDTPGAAKAVAVANGYAYVADNTSIQVIDVHVPGSAASIGSLSMSAASAVAVAGTRLAVLDGALLKIVSVSSPGSPTLLSSSDAMGARGVDATGSTVFLASAAVDPVLNKGGLYLVNATDPANPTLLTSVYGGFGSAGVAVSGSLAVAGGGSAGMKVVDLSVPNAPQTIGSLGGSIGGVALAGQYAYALLSIPGNPAHTDLLVIDLSNPFSPAVRAQITLAGGTDIKVSGGFVYVTCGSAGLQIVNVSAPANPQIVRTLDTPGAAKGIALANGYAYVADNSSVQVVDVHMPATAFVAGTFSTTAASAIAVAGTQLYVIDGTQLRILNVSVPSSPTQSSISTAYGAQAIDAGSEMAFLARPAIDHSDPSGGLYIVDTSNPVQPQLLTQLIVPGLTRAVAATAGFVYAGDSAAVIDVGRITVPTPTPTLASSSTPTRTSTLAPTSTRSPTATPPPTPPLTATPTSTSASPTATSTAASTPTSTPTAAFGSFRCYNAHVKSRTTPFAQVSGAGLVDHYATLTSNVRSPASICNPADMNGQDPAAPMQPAHLTGYPLRLVPNTPKFVKQLAQPVVNEFGSTFVDVLRPTRLLVPGAQSLSDPPPMPSAEFDSFDCYQVRLSANVQSLATPPSTALVADQFATVTVNVKAPTMLCIPVNRDDLAPGAETHPDLLMCYKATAVRGTPRFTKVTPVFVTNPLQQGTLEAPLPRELCVPTRFNP